MRLQHSVREKVTMMIIQRLRLRWMTVLFFAALLAVAGCHDGAAKKEPVSGGQDQIKELVGKIIDAYGGPQVVEGIASLSAQGVVEAPALYRGEAKYVSYLERNRKLRVEMQSQGFLELRVLNRRRSYYKANGFPLIEVRGARYLAMVYQFKELTMPYLLLKGHFEITDEGRSELSGTPVAVLGLRDKEGPPMKIYIDLKQYLIVKDSAVFTLNGASSRLSSEFQDFRYVDKMPLPFKIVSSADGRKTGETVIQGYQLNPPLGNGLFER